MQAGAQGEAAIGYINIGIEEIDDPRRETSIEVVRNALCNARSVLGVENNRDERVIPVSQLERYLRTMLARHLGTMEGAARDAPNGSIVNSCNGGRNAIEEIAREFGMEVAVDRSEWVNVYGEAESS